MAQTEPTEQRRDLLTLDELIRLTGWGRTFVYDGAKRDALPIPTLKAGKRYYFSRAAFERWANGESGQRQEA